MSELHGGRLISRIDYLEERVTELRSRVRARQRGLGVRKFSAKKHRRCETLVEELRRAERELYWVRQPGNGEWSETLPAPTTLTWNRDLGLGG